jgi:hypothetical protein
MGSKYLKSQGILNSFFFNSVTLIIDQYNYELGLCCRLGSLGLKKKTVRQK